MSGRGMASGGFGHGRSGFGNPGFRGGVLKMPPGWEECPPHGGPIEIGSGNFFKVIPSKVPLSKVYDRLLKNPAQSHYTINDAINSVEGHYGKVSLVIDLTRSTRYYNFDREVPAARLSSNVGLTDNKIYYIKIPCQGHNQSPEPSAVNAAVFEIKRMMSWRPDDYIIVHCTHGFNRTGYVIVNAMVRTAAKSGLSITRCLKRFAAARPPGIYKDSYITDLFKYHHEVRSASAWLTPPVPGWKGHGDDDDEGELEPPPEPPKDITHERIEEIGEEILPEEVFMIQALAYEWLTGAQLPENKLPHFPGSQPVSLDRQNLSLLQCDRYWVSWKADGTRYLLLILEQGCYLINREFKVVRLQMRFPTTQKPSAIKQYPVGPPHHETLLDGEMVVDVDPTSGVKTRRYLAYDLVYLRGTSLRTSPWLQRFMDLQKEVISPRDKEKLYIQRPQPDAFISPPLAYKYETEACSVRIKNFWPLFWARKVIDKMIPGLCHAADGLILQSCNASYVANTDNALLKFKFAHMNSVDFYLEVQPTAGRSGGQGYHIYVLDTSKFRRGSGSRDQGWSKKKIEQPVLFPEGVDGRSFHTRIIECCWIEAKSSWMFMRMREDKDLPNADYVCKRVISSIKDNIREPELLDYLDSVFYHIPHYLEDTGAMPQDARPPSLPPPPPALPSLPPAKLRSQGPAAALAEVDGDASTADGMVDPDALHYEPLVYPVASPPYFGPEPTPPHSPGKEVLPNMWTIHDPLAYPQEYLPVYDDPGAVPLDDPSLPTAHPLETQQAEPAGWAGGHDLQLGGGHSEEAHTQLQGGFEQQGHKRDLGAGSVEVFNGSTAGGHGAGENKPVMLSQGCQGSEGHGLGVDPDYAEEEEGDEWGRGKEEHGQLAVAATQRGSGTGAEDAEDVQQQQQQAGALSIQGENGDAATAPASGAAITGVKRDRAGSGGRRAGKGQEASRPKQGVCPASGPEGSARFALVCPVLIHPASRLS